MIKNNKLLIIAMALLTLMIFFIPTYSMASSNPIDNPDSFKPSGAGDATKVVSKANTILGVVTTIGVITAVVTLIILGIKYMFGSVEEKADYKKSMIPYIIGIVLLLSISGIVALIANLTGEAVP